MSWKPIETAPKDGTLILVFGNDYENNPAYGITSWVTEIVEYWEEINDNTQKKKKRDDSHWDYRYEGFPSHWMPLPESPVTSEGES